MYELQARLGEHHVYYQTEVEAFCKVYFQPKPKESPGDHAKMNAILDQAVERHKALPEEEQEQFKGLLVSFRNLYGFLSQVIPYQDTDLEKLYTYARFLLTKLPRRSSGPVYRLDDEVQLKYYRLQKISEGSIDLHAGEAAPLYGPGEVGTGKMRDEEIELSQLIDILNERFGTDFQPADQLFFDQVREQAVADETLQQAARVNTLEDFKYIFDKALEGLFIDRMDGNEEIFAKLMNDDKFRDVAARHLLRQVYDQIRSAKPN
jgi:type I restriction enzyme R subunit